MLIDEGVVYYECCVVILVDLDEVYVSFGVG